ncbi:ArsR/SmtB family transcription factor [Bacillus sp. mrc49]|uniref:ArsR/SmtB family transcription factor n=1 Tax=Bacillus sp. mrc49 TaxID=2054913 RepID=UPI000C27C1E9|nr:ArsR family transcriptional regulator [Bacillus sp. mrc49]PJN88554.1 ArsR family transcriptional regulator [Bacillus sp. mrc49]
MRTLHVTFEEALDICKALSNEHRMTIIRILSEGPKNINDLSDMLNIPFSTTAVNVKKLENSGVITTQIIPGRGSQKVSYKRYDRIIIDLVEKTPDTDDSHIIFKLGVGEYVHCEVEPTCGLLSETGTIHVNDDPRSFYEPDRRNAQLIWFRSGFVEYHFPNRIPNSAKVGELSFSVELCSEAPSHQSDWPSDITCWVNGVEIGFWTSPGDFGGERGLLTPSWWPQQDTQYGVLKIWKINGEGCFIDGEKISSITIDELGLHEQPYISLKLGVKKDAKNKGGINLFGEKFGNHDQGIIMKICHKSF